MKKDPLGQRDRLADAIGVPREILRGSLLERTIRHKKGCRTCGEGGGHAALVLSVNYPGGRNKQISLRPDQKARAERWLANYHRLKERLENICELNQVLLRSEE
ncbi:MAG TPA: DUF6788 family protein [Candidatus Acidoferrum sp.]|nr:DUF6788 family protein [Candidatus Acidoferrum sp.]